MDYYETWSQHRMKIPPGDYELYCVKAEKRRIWHEGHKAWGESEKVILWFEVSGGDFSKAIVPMFLPLKNGGKVHQGTKYFGSWCIANNLNRPSRNRLKEMPPSKFEKKLFLGTVVDVKPKWKNGREQPAIFHYSRVDFIYELLAGNPIS